MQRFLFRVQIVGNWQHCIDLMCPYSMFTCTTKKTLIHQHFSFLFTNDTLEYINMQMNNEFHWLKDTHTHAQTQSEHRVTDWFARRRSQQIHTVQLCRKILCLWICQVTGHTHTHPYDMPHTPIRHVNLLHSSSLTQMELYSSKCEHASFLQNNEINFTWTWCFHYLTE